jgi:transposase-like protein
VVELRETLRERVELARRPRLDGRRRYTEEQKTRALALLAEGKTPKEAAFAVGATSGLVRQWADRAGQTHGGRRWFTDEEIRYALELVESGATMSHAARTVGASKTAVLRWARAAA